MKTKISLPPFSVGKSPCYQWSRWARVPSLLGMALLLILTLVQPVPGATLSTDPVPPPPSGAPVSPRLTDTLPSLTAADDPVPPPLYTQLHDDEVTWWFARQDAASVTTARLLLPDGTVTNITSQSLPFALPTPLPFPNSTYVPPVEFATGRVVDNHADQLIAVTKTGYDATSHCFNYTVAGFVNPNTSSQAFSHPLQLQPCLEARELWYTSPFGIAVGDLDRVADDNGNLHDEIVIVHESGLPGSDPPGGLTVFVADYGAHPGEVTATAITLPADNTHAFNRLYYPSSFSGVVQPGQVRVAVFDADGSGAKRIVTMHTATWDGGQQSGVALNVLRYDAVEGLSLLASTVNQIPQFSVPMDLAVGDFDDDGKEEIAVAFVHIDITTDSTEGFIFIYSLEGNDLAPIGLGQFGIGDVSPDFDPPVPISDILAFAHTDLHLVSGVFQFDPDSGFTLTRKQLALAYFSVHSGLVVRLVTVGGSGDVTLGPVYAETTNIINPSFFHGPIDFRFDLVAGGFAGVKASPPNPTWGLALGYNTNGFSPDVMVIDFLQATEGNVLSRLTSIQQDKPSSGQYATRLLSFDFDGDALYLGAPVAFTATTLQQTLSAIRQPPQHLDYLPAVQGANSTTGLLNISRNPNFKVVFSEQQQTNVTTQHTSAFSWTVGGSEKVSASATTTESVPFVAKAQLSASASEKVSFTHDHSKTSTAGVSDTLTVDMSVSPTDDDGLNIITQQMQIWRYRIYGAQNEDPETANTAPNAFYEVHVPLGATHAWWGGKNVDAYQPLHENGNILSYPQIDATTGNYTPPDLGSWKPPLMPPTCTDVPAQDFPGFSTPLTGSTPQAFSYSGIQTTFTVKMDQSETCGTQRKTTNTLNEEADLTYKVTEKASEVLASETASVTATFTLQSNQSWATLDTHNTTSSESETFQISTVAFDDPGWSYNFLPVMYFAPSGNLKLSFATSTAGGNWGTIYNNPDPAFNLPNKFIAPAGTWTVNTRLDAQQIRGFFVRDGKNVDSTTGLGPVLGAPPTWGDPVQIEVLIYNYSTRSQIQNIPVRFDIADFDAATQTVTNRRVLGTVMAEYTDEANPAGQTSPSKTFPPRGIGRAVYLLDTTQLPEPPTGGLSEYVVFAVIDPDQTLGIRETHGWREANVNITPKTDGIANVGTQLTLTVLNDQNTQVGTISVSSQGDVSTDIGSLADAFNVSAIAKQYGVQAIPTPPQSPQASPTHLVLTAGTNSALPSNTEFRATIAFVNAVRSTTALHFLPSVTVPPGGTAAMTASNLLFGQNNEGYGQLSVAGPPSPNAEAIAEQGNDLFLRTDSLGAVDLSGHFETRQVTALMDRPLDIRVCGHTDALHRRFARVGVYLGDPDEGGTGLALKRLHGIHPEKGACAWFTWTPKELGDYTLHAVLQEDPDDIQPTNNRVTLEVRVVQECDLAQASPTLLWPPNHTLVPVRIGGVAHPMVTEVTQDEPVNGLGKGKMGPDAAIQGDTVLLRAERAAKGNGRVYEVSFTTDDSHGEGCTGSVTVCVPHDQRATICIDDGQFFDSLQP